MENMLWQLLIQWVSDKENPISHVAYGYATQLVLFDDEGKLVKVLAAHDVGRAINPIEC